MESNFASTQWTLVRRAGAGPSAEAREAFAALCAQYWQPLYSYIRRSGRDASTAEDLTQGFFARLLEKGDLSAARHDKGRFRSFLLACLRHYLSHEHERQHALKRGGGRHLSSIDAGDAESRYQLEPLDQLTPERLFDRRWALTLLEQALERVGRHYEAQGQAALFAALKSVLTDDGSPAEPYAEIAARLEMTPDAVKTAAHRLRRKYRDELRSAIRNTVESDAEVDQELADLREALRNG